MTHPSGRARCLLGSLLWLMATSTSAATVWRDTFDNTAQLPWSSVRGTWQVASGEYSSTTPGNIPPTAALLPYDLSDFSFEVDLVQPVDGGLWVRTNSDASAGVMLVVFADSLYWHVISDPDSGPWTIHGQATLSPALSSGTNRIRVTGHGPILRAYVNGAKVAASTLDLTTVTNPPGMNYLRGRVGLYDNASPGTRFDNIRLEAGTPIEVVAIGDAGNQAVRLFPVDASGDVAPLVTLAGGNTGLSDVRGVILDSETLYVSSGTGRYIKAFALGSLGDVPALRTIQGPATGLGAVYNITLVGPNLFAASDTAPVSIFAADAQGDVPPTRIINEAGAYGLDASSGEVFIAGHFLNAEFDIHLCRYRQCRHAATADTGRREHGARQHQPGSRQHANRTVRGAIRGRPYSGLSPQRPG
ncbi:MAG: hypothetical protein IPK97_05505 [Ahniella sp.]|nr:hypothetical protein [Ahniella sp.]